MSDPTESATRPRPLDPEAFSRFAVRDPREIVQLLGALTEKHALITGHLDERTSFITVMLASDGGSAAVVLDAAPEAAINQRLAAGAELVCMTRLDNVRVQFSLSAIEAVRHDGRGALRANLPTSLLRLQRREFFRLAAPRSAPPVCTITQVQPDGRSHVVSVRILDISGGGLAVLVPPQALHFEPGMDFDHCALVLPEGEPLPVRLTVRNLFDIKQPNGTRARRAGCQFVGLSNSVMARLQRYLFKLERERHAQDAE
ncbi:flagellar brake protein [Azoarcus sp. PA01]|nr:flagellar brake protein [Azoarcus sp. PA01]